MGNIMQNYGRALFAAAIFLALLLSSVVIVPETQQAVIIRTGEPVSVINRFRPNQEFGETGAGLWYRIPLIERVQMVDRRILNLDMEPQQVLSSDQQRLQVDAYARFRIIDPVLMVESAGSEDNLRAQLAPILSSVLRQELGRRPFIALLTAERGTAMTNITRTLDVQARQYGAQVIDVRIKRADLPDGSPLETAFTRMQTDRQAEAETIKAQGGKDAQIIRAEAEAQAAATYALAYNKDPEFYDFYRAMESYRRTFDQGTGESTMILSEDSEYFRQFRGRR
ncbi:MAG: protease modulator HflC [Sphingomonadales bacterium BRH_c42]|nr:MAG: protease modulator HflC [Sphingomonadales bacterium BRH_c42]